MESAGSTAAVAAASGPLRWRLAAQWPLGLAVALPLLAFALQGDIGLNLWDEGFLWYGAQRVLAGEVPLRDFQSYDLGRYYWSAAWLWATGSDGIVALRFGNAALAAITGAIAALLLQRGAAAPAASRPGSGSAAGSAAGSALRAVFVALAIVAMSLLVLLRAEGTADAFAVLLLVAALARALERPADRRRWLAGGAALGIAAAIGINHALYGTLGFGLAALHLWRLGDGAALRRAVAPLALGVALGYSPVLLPMAFAPGFAAAFVDSIRMLFEWGTTNLDLPLVPAEPRLAALVALAAAAGLACLVALLAAPRPAAGVGEALDRDADRDAGDDRAGAPARDDGAARATFTAATLLALPYAHYAVSRMDLEHVAVSALPIIVAAAAHPWRLPPPARLAAIVAVAALAFAVVWPRQPLRWALAGWPLEATTIRDETVRLKPWEAAEVALLRRLAAAHGGGDGDGDGGDTGGGRGGRAFYAAPYWPGAYAVFGQRSPTWEIYAIFPSTDARQQREIDRLAAADIAFAVVSPARVDGRDDLGFAHTHPLVDAWLAKCYRRVPVPLRADATRNLRTYVAEPGDPGPTRSCSRRP